LHDNIVCEVRIPGISYLHFCEVYLFFGDLFNSYWIFKFQKILARAMLNFITEKCSTHFSQSIDILFVHFGHVVIFIWILQDLPIFRDF
jgi:hypothetical protein